MACGAIAAGALLRPCGQVVPSAAPAVSTQQYLLVLQQEPAALLLRVPEVQPCVHGVAGHQYQIPEMRRRESIRLRRSVLAMPAAAAAGAAAASQAAKAVGTAAAAAPAAAAAGCGASEAGRGKPDLARGQRQEAAAVTRCSGRQLGWLWVAAGSTGQNRSHSYGVSNAGQVT